MNKDFYAIKELHFTIKEEGPYVEVEYSKQENGVYSRCLKDEFYLKEADINLTNTVNELGSLLLEIINSKKRLK